MKIVVKQSCIIINDYEIGDSYKLEKTFSIWDPIRFTSYFKGIHYDEENKRLYLPRGLDIPYIENLFGESAYVEKGKHDRFTRIEKAILKYSPRDDEQKEALRFMVGKGEYNRNELKSQISVNLNTGKGKTYCSIATISYLQMRAAIITSSIGWLEQWSDNIQEYTDTTKKEIYMISGSGSIHRILKKDVSQYKYFLISHSTIRSYGEKFGWDKITELFKHLQIGIKVYDEAHLNFDNICKIDFYTNTYKTFYVTATPSRSDDDENRIFQLYFKNVPAISLFNENKDPHTDYKAIHFKSLPTPQQISDCKGAYGIDRNKYVDYITSNDNFYKLLTYLMTIIDKTRGKVLIYIGTNNGIKKVKAWMDNNYPEYEGDIGVYTSLVTENKELELEKKIILSTTKSSGAAIDIAGLKMTIVLAEPFKSEVIARQTLGRTRASDTTYIEIVDDSFAQLRKYYNYKKPIFDTYARTCQEGTLKPDVLQRKYEMIKAQRYPHPIYYIRNEFMSPIVTYNENQLVCPIEIIE